MALLRSRYLEPAGRMDRDIPSALPVDVSRSRLAYGMPTCARTR